MAEGDKKNPKLKKLRALLRKKMKIEMTDGRVLEGEFVCTDSQQNVILGECLEYLKPLGDQKEDPRTLGLAMVPGHHIVSIKVEASSIKDIDSFFLDVNNGSTSDGASSTEETAPT